MVAATLLLVGCGEQRGEERRDQPPRAGDVPTTPGSLAYIAAEYLGEPDYATKGSNWSHVFGPRPIEATLWFGSDGQNDGDSVVMIVGRASDDITDCSDLSRYIDGCEALKDGLWYWGEQEPEEDPGGVFVVQHKGKVTVRVSYNGPSIKGDPREQDLPIDVQSLIDLAADPRVDMTTDQDVVEQGAKAAYWHGS
jgi:hypothetical protein